MTGLHLLAPESSNKFVFVISRHRQSVRVANHAHCQAKNTWGVWATINQITEKDDLSTLRMDSINPAPDLVALDVVTEFPKQRLKFGQTAVDVSNRIEWTGLLPEIVQQRLANDIGCGNLVDAPEDVNPPKSLFAERAKGTPQLILLAANDARSEFPILTQFISSGADAFRHIKDDSDREDVVVPRKLHQAGARCRLDVRRVDDC
ncbi:hypothetical protein BH11ACT2_BH11ACT2_21440 [soil metagenome]